jgi:hypothetical protein
MAEPAGAMPPPEPAPDPRPRPRYGEYADPSTLPPPVVSTPAAPAAAPVAAAPTERPRRTWDVVITTALLALAVYDVVGGFSTFANLAPAIQAMFDQTGVGEFTATAVAQQWGFIANAGRIAILVIVILVSLLLIARRRIAFWVPLVGGALAVIVAVICIAVIIVSDPAYLAYLTAVQP